MVTGIGSARARGMALSELAALQRGLMLSDPFIASVTFPGAEALVVLGGPGEQRRAQLGLSASRDDWHRALAASGNLAPPVEGPATGLPADETTPARAQYAEMLHDLGEHAEGLSYRGRKLTYDSITFDGVAHAAVVVVDPSGQFFRTLFDFDHSSGAPVGTPYSIADWIADGRGSTVDDGTVEMPPDASPQ